MAPLQLLKQAVTAHVRVRGARHQRDRRGVDVGGGHADDGVRRARPDAREGEDRSARRPVVAVGEVDRGLLVDHLDRADLVLPVEQGVGQVPRAVARDPGDMADALADEVLDDDLRPRQAQRGGPRVAGVAQTGVASATVRNRLRSGTVAA
jgi:hypothetical protein